MAALRALARCSTAVVGRVLSDRVGLSTATRCLPSLVSQVKVSTGFPSTPKGWSAANAYPTFSTTVKAESKIRETLEHLKLRLDETFAMNPGFVTTLEGDKLSVAMTDGGHLLITKKDGDLQVDTLFTDLSKPHEKLVKTFHLNEQSEWVADSEEELYSYLEDGFSEYLNMLVDLDEEDTK